MKYLFLFFFILTTSQSQRTGLNFVPSEQVQFRLHTNEAVDVFLSDNELQKLFPISDYFYPSTRFWFLIYTYFDDTKLVIHDRDNLGLIYKIQDFSSLESKNVHRYAQSFIQDEFIKKRINELKEQLVELASNPLPSSSEQVTLYNQVQRAGINTGKTPEEHYEAFIRLSKNVRAQRGLKNHIESGLARYNLYADFLDKYFLDRGLPKELIAISFLESSFNPNAHSKSRAVGVWQFMPFLQNSFFPKHKKIDYRLNVGISSVAAASLLQENYKILKRWDLAVTAYNSGIKHILKERRSKSALTLQDLIQGSENSRFGFASKNFYSEFLALTRVLKYREQLFPILQNVDPLPDLHFYFAKCDINLIRGFKATEREYLKSLNLQIKRLNMIPKGTLITTDSDLSPVFYQKVSWNDLLKKRPKQWMDPKRRYSCSTR